MESGEIDDGAAFMKSCDIDRCWELGCEPEGVGKGSCIGLCLESDVRRSMQRLIVSSPMRLKVASSPSSSKTSSKERRRFAIFWAFVESGWGFPEVPLMVPRKFDGLEVPFPLKMSDAISTASEDTHTGL